MPKTKTVLTSKPTGYFDRNADGVVTVYFNDLSDHQMGLLYTIMLTNGDTALHDKRNEVRAFVKHYHLDLGSASITVYSPDREDFINDLSVLLGVPVEPATW